MLLFAAAIHLACILSPPSLMDDVDAVQAQISRNMLSSGDWVTARLDGVAYLEKSPLIYWLMALSFKLFGAHDWAARIPVALSSIALAVVVAEWGKWAFGRAAGFYAGLCVASCIGLWLFTRILIPDVMLTLTIALGLWAFLRVCEDDEPHPRLWASVLAACLGVGLLLKSLIAVVFPLGAAVLYLLLTRRLGKTWRRFHLFSGTAIVFLIAAPWHILATLRNPPFFSLSMHSGPGEYHGFLWFYFINEQLLRFLNLRYPRDYNTVPRLYFWLFHLIWLFPWSMFLPAVAKLSFRPVDRAGRTRLLALCWIGFILVFFTFSTTQEYYSMPAYPAFALLLGSAMAEGGGWIRRGSIAAASVAAVAAAGMVFVLATVWRLPNPGDISAALSHHPGAYTLSLGHMEDLTLQSFAYLRPPLALAAIACLIGAVGAAGARGERAFLSLAVMMVVFFQAARIAMVDFDPFLSSRPLAEAILKAPPGTLVFDSQYYTFSSVAFYTNRRELLLNGRFNNLEYGSYAPSAPHVFIKDDQMRSLWGGPDRIYVVTKEENMPRLEHLLGSQNLRVLAFSGGKLVCTNSPLP